MTHEDADNWNQTRKLQQKTECLAQESKQEGSEAITYLQLKIERPKQNAKKKKKYNKKNHYICFWVPVHYGASVWSRVNLKSRVF